MEEQTGSNEATTAGGLERLYVEHRQALRRFLIARTGSATDADDLLQETWFRLRRTDSGPIADGRSYIFRIAHNLVLDRVREEGRRRQRERAWGDSVEVSAAETPDPHVQVSDQQEAERLKHAIAELPPGAARAFRLHKLEELSHAETAARLGISRKGVEKHMAVAWAHLHRLLGEGGLG